jgi:hypothetical protein
MRGRKYFHFMEETLLAVELNSIVHRCCDTLPYLNISNTDSYLYELARDSNELEES